MKNNFAKEFVKDRRKAFTAAVMENDWKAVVKYCEKYGMTIPEDKSVLKASVYKAVQECTDISLEIKKEAYKKCIKLGFKPFVNWNEDDAE